MRRLRKSGNYINFSRVQNFVGQTTQSTGTDGPYQMSLRGARGRSWGIRYFTMNHWRQDRLGLVRHGLKTQGFGSFSAMHERARNRRLVLDGLIRQMFQPTANDVVAGSLAG